VTELFSGVDTRWILDGADAELRQLAELPALPDEQRRQTLQQLASGASAGPHEMHRLALAFASLGNYEEAISLFQLILRYEPSAATVRLNLATTYLHLELPGLALEELEKIHDSTDKDRWSAIGMKRLEQLRAINTLRAANRHLIQLRVAALREQLEPGDATPTVLCQLGRDLFQLAAEPDSGVEWPDAILVLEKAQDAAPDDIANLQTLAHAYHITGREDALADVVRRLERLAPHADVPQPSRAGDIDAQAAEDWIVREQLLWSRALDADQPSSAALQEVRRLAKLFPNNLGHKNCLMAYELSQGNVAAAVRIADELTVLAPDVHDTHFNVAQVYCLAGQMSRARHHLSKAYDLAADDQERTSIVQLRESIEQAHGSE
jgi:tetratricopeptide (TPR) repeat protein